VCHVIYRVFVEHVINVTRDYVLRWRVGGSGWGGGGSGFASSAANVPPGQGADGLFFGNHSAKLLGLQIMVHAACDLALYG
jgi:hypothetical protein